MKNILFAVSLLGALAACTPTQQTMTDAQSTAAVVAWTQVNLTLDAMPTDTPTVTPTAILIEFTPSPLPTQPPIPFITPDPIQVERWKEYQIELARAILYGYDPSSLSSALCEWDILERSDQEVYVWVICGASESSSRKPVVIYLDTDGSIQNVKFDGYEGVFFDLGSFPADAQQKINMYYSSSCKYCGRAEELGSHLDYRLTHPEEPPLIILSVISTPSPTPIQPVSPFITPDADQVKRWKEYQTELAETLIPSIPPQMVLCEWEVLGRSDQDLFVWAVCGKIGGGRWASRPVVIHLESDGSIQNVSLVSGIGSEYINNIQQMFPLDVQEKILNDQTSSMIYQQLSEHLNWRQIHPEEPPLIVLSAIPTATPTP